MQHVIKGGWTYQVIYDPGEAVGQLFRQIECVSSTCHQQHGECTLSQRCMMSRRILSRILWPDEQKREHDRAVKISRRWLQNDHPRNWWDFSPAAWIAFALALSFILAFVILGLMSLR